jgi:hypothetical protein
LVLEYLFAKYRAMKLSISIMNVRITADAKALSLTSGMGDPS